MAYGFQAFNDSGDVTIDGDRQNYFLVERSSRSVTFHGLNDQLQGSAFPEFYAPLTVLFNRVVDTSAPPYIAIRHTSGRGVGVVKFNGSPGNWYGFDVCTYVYYNSGEYVSCGFQYEVYAVSDRALTLSNQAGFYYPSLHGIIVNDASGNRVFDSRMVNLAIESVGAMNTGLQNHGGTFSWTDAVVGDVVGSKASSQAVDAFCLMGLYGGDWAMKLFLQGNNIIRHWAYRSPFNPEQGTFIASYFGCHEENVFPYFRSRWQSLP